MKIAQKVSKIKAMENAADPMPMGGPPPCDNSRDTLFGRVRHILGTLQTARQKLEAAYRALGLTSCEGDQGCGPMAEETLEGLLSRIADESSMVFALADELVAGIGE